MGKPLETVKEFSERTPFSPGRVRFLIRDGELTYVKIGGRYMIPDGAYEALISRNTVEAMPCQDEAKGRDSGFSTSEVSTTSAGRKAVGAASALRAQKIAESLKSPSRSSSTRDNGRAAPVIPLKS
jgi:hypothetical protein